MALNLNHGVFKLFLPLNDPTLRKTLKITVRVLLVLLGLIILALIAIQTPPVQNWLVKQAAKRLSRDLNTEVSVKRVSISFFDKLDLEGTLIKDHQKDTLLYAGSLKVRITDWFIFKDKADLKYIGLEDAIIKTNRTDSIWNYQFLVDYFSPKKTATTKKKSGLALHLKKLDFKNVVYKVNDKWIGQDQTIKFGSLLLDANNIDLNESDIDISEITLDKPYFHTLNYPGLRPKTKSKTVSAFHLNPGGLKMRIARLNITNGTYATERQKERAPLSYFDGLHISFGKINGSISNFSFIGDSIKANVDVATKERSGFEVNKLKAKFLLTPQIMEFKELDLQTPRSHLRDYYAMHFDDFNHDMANYITNVVMHVRFRQANIHSDDIAFFAPDLRDWNREIAVSGIIKGTVDNLDAKGLYARAGNSVVSGNVAVKGLPDVNTAYFSLSPGQITTNYNDLALYIPALRNIKSPNLYSLGTIRYNGVFNGNFKSFKTKGNIVTDIGTVAANLSMTFPSRAQPTYSGILNTNRLDLGKFFNSKDLGIVSLSGKVSGSGFDLNTLRTNFDGSIPEFSFKNYTYRNIVTNGSFAKKVFEGEVKIDDPNLDFTSNIIVDFKGDVPSITMLGDVVKADLMALQLSKKQLELAGLFDLNFAGTNIDNFIGSAKLINASLLHDSTRLSFDSLALQSDFVNGQKVLSVQSNEMDVTVAGKYSILDLPASIQSYLHSYYPSYINQPKIVPLDQNFNVTLNTRNISDFIRIFEPRLSGFDNAFFKGSVNTTRADSGFTIQATVPAFVYDKVSFTGVAINGTGDVTTLKLLGNVDVITVGDSLYFPNTALNIVSANDVSTVNIKTKANNTLNEADLNAQVTTLEDGVRIDFKPSSFVINEERWTLEKEGVLSLRKNFVFARDVRFTQGTQEVTLSTRMPDGGNVNELVINLRNIHLGDIMPYITREPRLEGLASGEIIMTDFFDQFTAHATLQAHEFRLDDDSIGLVNILANYSKRTGKLDYSFHSDNPEYNLTLRGAYDTKDATAPLASKLKLNNTPITFINRFLSTIFSDITGYATGDIELHGTINRPHILGKVTLRNAGFKVNFTRVYYYVDSVNLDFREDRLTFGQFTIRDKFDNTGTAKGMIYQKAFKNMRFDFDVFTNKMLMLDTKATDNENFYGTAVGKAAINITGPESNILMNIVGELNDTSHIYIPTSDKRESGEAGFIVFKKIGQEQNPTAATGSTNLVVDLDVTANNKVGIDVILDELTGDVLKATGNGRLRIHAGTNEDVSIRGRYNIERGSYDFNFQSVLRRPFVIVPGENNYIEWNGDPYNAEIHVDAQYTAENVSLGDLMGNKSIDLGGDAKTYRGDVYVIASLTEKLTKPNIRFRFGLPSTASFLNDPTFNEFLKALQSDPNEMNKQVTYLLVFGSFAPYQEGRNLAQNLYNFTYSSISGAINKGLDVVVSNLLYKVFKIRPNNSFRFDVNASGYNSSAVFGNNNNPSGRLDMIALNVKLVKSFLNDKIVVNVGRDFDLAVAGTAATLAKTDLAWLPNVNIELALTRSRKLKFIIFTRNNLGLNENSTSVVRRNRTGVSLSFSHQFDHLFRKEEEEKKKEVSSQ